jgi:chemosensory pili system protein ChpA (sensor histidine kinase/response regulator)
LVVKNIGPQLARVVGIAGATVLGDGEIVLILNPLALVGRTAGQHADVAPAQPVQAAPVVAPVRAGLVMVVDDSLTVRKITSRLLAREGYHVRLAKDGVDALEQLIDIVPDVMLVDIEMPRMDGFDLTRNVRADERLKKIPIVMITSRIADKHRNYARDIGVNHYLGKPYDEEELLRILAGYTGRDT